MDSEKINQIAETLSGCNVKVCVAISTDTIANTVKRMESFTRLIEKLSEEEACHGMTELIISAKIG